MAAFAVGMVAFIVTLSSFPVVAQWNLADANDAPDILPWMLAAFGIGHGARTGTGA